MMNVSMRTAAFVAVLYLYSLRNGATAQSLTLVMNSPI